MYFQIKNILKNNYYYTLKYPTEKENQNQSGGEDATQPTPPRKGHHLFNIKYIWLFSWLEVKNNKKGHFQLFKL